MWISKRLDVSWPDLAYGLAGCVVGSDRSKWANRVEQLWSPAGDAVACLSVRSGFDLLLSAASFPPGSEIVFSALTIADMPRIAEEHGLVPVPIDIDPATASPPLDGLVRAVNARTRAIVITHLYGSRPDIESVVTFAKDRGILLVEDCARAFAGRAFTGHPESDVTMFSFGPIKTATALGGGMLRVRDAELRGRMRAHQEQYPEQGAGAYGGRLLKYAAIHVASGRLAYGALLRCMRWVGVDHDQVMHRLTRGFSGPDFFTRIRRRPSGALLRLLYRRLCQDGARLAQRTTDGEHLLGLLEDRVVSPGGRVRPHFYWIFPILVDDPPRLIHALRAAGYDATEGRSFDVVATPAVSGEQDNRAALEIMAHTVFLPFYPGMTAAGWEGMARVVKARAGKPVRVRALQPLGGSDSQD
jgi:dTDP-4-amino-4,6-dideoxygalactose transaminase